MSYRNPAQRALGAVGRASDDPLTDYAERLALAIIGALSGVPQTAQRTLLRVILDELEPGLYRRVAEHDHALRLQRVSRDPFREALVASLHEGVTRELIELGTSGREPAAKSLLGLGVYRSSRRATSGWWSDAVDFVGGAVDYVVVDPLTDAWDYGTDLVEDGAEWTWGKASDAGAWAWGNVEDAGGWVWDTAGGVLDKAGDLMCGALSSPASGVAASAAATYYGAPPQAGAAGSQIGRDMCSGGRPAVPARPDGFPWVPVLAIGGGAAFLLTLAVVLKK